MATGRAIRGVLGNFLGTYTSRYSEYRGYWLFGFLVADLEEVRIDLVGSLADDANGPLRVAVESAVARFADQMRKGGLVRAQIQEGWLTMRKLPGEAMGSVNGIRCVGFNVRVLAAAVMNDGKRFERQQVMFVAVHNANVELRSARAAETHSGRDGHDK